ncbi:PLC-like phosphodiesterase [Hypoxylon sp. FL0890]|nr:PLC-like phosphodiesterase [Hypoxylon sp. FL0890]
MYSLSIVLGFAIVAVADLGQFALQKVLQNGIEVFGPPPSPFPYSSSSSSSPPSSPPSPSSLSSSSSSSSSSHPYASSPPKSYPNWMSTLPDSTPLAHLNIPGTHDAATWNYTQSTQTSLSPATRCDGTTVYPAVVYRCQRLGLAAALDAGVRFFDLRVALDPLGSNLVFWHSAALLSARATVGDVLFGFYDWLEEHRGEVVLLSFQYEVGTQANASFTTAAQDALREVLMDGVARGYVRRDGGGYLGTLGESRGKIVLVRRFDLDGEGEEGLPGLHLSPTKWPDNDPDAFALVYNTTTNATAYIEDYYEPDALGSNSTVEENIATKMDAVKAHLQKAAAAYAVEGGQRDVDSLFITFASAEHNMNNPPVFPETMALGNGTEVTPNGGVNHQLVSLLQGMRGSRLGIVVVDFYDEPAELVGLILRS